VETFLQQHAAAIFGLVGAFGAGILSFVASWLLRKRDYDLRLWDKLLERRIRAHENVIAVALEMRVMVTLGGLDAKGDVLRAPQVLVSKEAFEEWFTRAVATAVEASTWLSTDAKREVNYLQDYLVTLHQNISALPSEAYLKIGTVIREDFIALSSSVERTAYSFFKKDIRCLRLSDFSEWHKYPREETERRLKGSRLLQAWDEIGAIGSSV
jgi:hypothetical protein